MGRVLSDAIDGKFDLTEIRNLVQLVKKDHELLHNYQAYYKALSQELEEEQEGISFSLPLSERSMPFGDTD